MLLFALPTPQCKGLSVIRQFSRPVQQLLHPEQGHQATFMLLPTVLGEQLLESVNEWSIDPPPTTTFSTWRGNDLTKLSRLRV